MKSCMLLFALFPALALALEPGERLSPWTLLDQFEQPYSLDQRLQVLLVARDMPGGELLHAALQGKPAGYLQARQAVFVADISRMPGAIAQLFAIPAMRDYAYRVLLDRQARVVPRYPVAEGSVLWIQLQAGRVESLRSYKDASALAQALEEAVR